MIRSLFLFGVLHHLSPALFTSPTLDLLFVAVFLALFVVFTSWCARRGAK